MSSTAGNALGACLALVTLLGPAAAAAVPGQGTTRIGLQLGWRYQPNGRFLEWASSSRHPLTGASPGGPSLLGVFGYRVLPELEVAIELGFGAERFRFRDDPAMTLEQMPVTLAVRWAPWGGALYPYLGAGYGYFLNFFSNAPGGTKESHGAGPTVLAGAVYDVTPRVSLVAEYRFAYCRVELTDLGYLQTGGSTFFLGAHVAFPPEDRRLK